ncbi:MAG: class F sortase [Ornithinimicrobium sp.]
MSIISRGRGHVIVPAVSLLLLLLGVAALTFVVMSQQADPPTPASNATSPSVIEASEPDSAVTTAPPAGPSESSGRSDEASATLPQPQAEAVTTAEAAPAPLSLEPSEPVAVRISSSDISSELHPLGLTEDGALDVPSGNLYNEAAWYDGSPTPGEIGPAVIEGHVTSQGSTPSVFFELGSVAVGDEIEVDRKDGSTATFEVYDTGSFPKDDFPSLAVYGRTNHAELRVITCGGDYSAEQRRHVDNVVVFARLVDAA